MDETNYRSFRSAQGLNTLVLLFHWRSLGKTQLVRQLHTTGEKASSQCDEPYTGTAMLAAGLAQGLIRTLEDAMKAMSSFGDRYLPAAEDISSIT